MYIIIILIFIIIVSNQGGVMEKNPVKTDKDLRELIDYKDVSFPLDTWADAYSSFPDYTLNCHWHNAFEFGTVIKGSLDFYTGETCLKLEKDDCIFVNSNVLHMAKQTDPHGPAVMSGVGFPPSLFPDGSIFQKYFQPVMKMPLQGFRIEAGNPHGQRLAGIIKDICRLSDEAYGYELRALSLLSRLWLETLAYLSEKDHPFALKETPHHHGTMVKQMISYIQEHFADNITIQDLTDYAHVSRSECFRFFRRYTGKKPMEYINEYRLLQAAGLLRDTSLSISEIGSFCGFCSSSYFGKLFKEKYGISPLAYRKEEPAN